MPKNKSNKAFLQQERNDIPVVEKVSDLCLEESQEETFQSIESNKKINDPVLEKDVVNKKEPKKIVEIDVTANIPYDKKSSFNPVYTKPLAIPGKSFKPSQPGVISKVEKRIYDAEKEEIDKRIVADLDHLMSLIGSVFNHLKEMEKKLGHDFIQSLKEDLFNE